MYLYSIFTPYLFKIKVIISVVKALTAGITSKPTISNTYTHKSTTFNNSVLIRILNGLSTNPRKFDSSIRLLPEIAKR